MLRLSLSTSLSLFGKAFSLYSSLSFFFFTLFRTCVNFLSSFFLFLVCVSFYSFTLSPLPLSLQVFVLIFLALQSFFNQVTKFHEWGDCWELIRTFCFFRRECGKFQRFAFRCYKRWEAFKSFWKGPSKKKPIKFDKLNFLKYKRLMEQERDKSWIRLQIFKLDRVWSEEMERHLVGYLPSDDRARWTYICTKHTASRCSRVGGSGCLIHLVETLLAPPSTTDQILSSSTSADIFFL